MAVSSTFRYVCEKCGSEVPLTIGDYEKRTRQAARAKEMRAAPEQSKWGKPIICDECDKPPLTQHPLTGIRRRLNKPAVKTMPRSEHLNLSPLERDDFGVTVTSREQRTKKVRVDIGYGPVTNALQDVVDHLDSLDGNWKIVTVSSPATIYGDLQGIRDYSQPSAELRFLAKIGRKDMVEYRKPSPFSSPKRKGGRRK